MKQSKINKYRHTEDNLLKEYKLDREEHFIKVEGYGIKVRVQVTGQGPPLFFIHGGPNAGSTWLELASLLPDYQCLILDRPGCGLSEAYSYNQLTRDKLDKLIVSVIDSVLDYFSLEKSYFLASSFGGYCAIRYALNRPEKVEKMIQEGAPALAEGSTLPGFMKSVSKPFLRWLIPKLPASLSNSEKIMKEIGHTHSINKGLLSDAFMKWYVGLCNHTDTMKHEFQLISKAVTDGDQNPEFLLRDSEIAQLQMPVLWLWGKDDGFAGSDIAHRIHGKVPHSKLVEFDLAGHLPWLDHPKEHAAQVRKFLSGRSQGKPEEKEALHSTA
jgi:pimeloyl-ACP methyl ester carboxylesterase